MVSRIAALLMFQTVLFGLHSSYELRSFADFLDYNSLNHGIITMCDNGSFMRKDLREMAGKHFWLSYFDVVEKESKMTNINEFDGLFYHDAPKVGIYLNMKCQSKADIILEYASSKNFFNSSQAWFILANSLAAGLEAFASLEVNIDADITLVIKNEKEDILRLHDLYKVCHRCGTTLLSEDKGIWSDSRGIEVLPSFWQTVVQRRKNFTNITLNGALVVTTTPEGMSISEYIDGFSNKHLDSMQRKSYHLLKILKDIYNFRLKVVISDSWGIQQDGNWTGAVGNIFNGEAAIALSPFRFTQQRVLAIHYLPKVHTEILGFLFRHPRRSPIRNIFLEPFTSVVWYTVSAIIAGGVILMAITMHHECVRYGSAGGIENKLDFFTLIILEAIFLQGPSQMFQFVSTRTIIISICIFAVMLYQFYSAFIVGSLLADVPRTIVNMPALFNSTLDVGMEDISYNYEFFINTSNQMAKDIYVHRIMRSPQMNILPLQKGMERIGRGGYAYYVAVDRAYRILKEQLTEAQFCDLQEVAMDPPFVCHSAVPHGSPYKEHFASAILQLSETGLMEYHDKLWSVEKPQCSHGMVEKDITIDMEHFIPALGFLVVAMITSWMVFGVEHLVHSLGATKIAKIIKRLQLST